MSCSVRRAGGGGRAEEKVVGKRLAGLAGRLTAGPLDDDGSGGCSSTDAHEEERASWSGIDVGAKKRRARVEGYELSVVV